MATRAPGGPRGGGASPHRGDFGGEALEGLADELPEDEPSGEVFVPDGVVVEERFLDFGRLVMAGPERGGGARGRLSPIGPWDSVFAVGVSMQVDVVMVLVEQWVERARAVDRLSLPPRCVTVAALDQFDFRYDCAARVDVPSTGAWATVPVMECRVGLAPQYVCVPAVEPKVYRTLDIRNDTVNALLAGPVDVSVGEDFLMTTAMPAVPPGATTARLGLGVEEAIKVARKSSFTETTGGFLGGSTVLRHDVEVELNNRLPAPASVEVRERVPQPAPDEKDAKVEEVKLEPPWEPLEGPIDGVIAHGQRRWRVTVPPGQRLRLAAQFAIRIPADKMLVGGNRRS